MRILIIMTGLNHVCTAHLRRSAQRCMQAVSKLILCTLVGQTPRAELLLQLSLSRDNLSELIGCSCCPVIGRKATSR